MFGASSARNSERWGLSIAQMAWRLGIMPAEDRRIEEEIAWRDCETRKGWEVQEPPAPTTKRDGVALTSPCHLSLVESSTRRATRC